jgi:hypothetical protein
MMTATAMADDDDDDDDGACRGRARRQQSLGNNLRVTNLSHKQLQYIMHP